MSSRPHPGSERPLHGPLQRFDLGTVVGRLKEEEAWQRGQRNSITLRKGGGMNVVLLVMKSGDRLEEHAAPGPLSLSVREGRIRFVAGEEVVEAGVRHAAHLRRRGTARGGGPERRGVPALHRGIAPGILRRGGNDPGRQSQGSNSKRMVPPSTHRALNPSSSVL